jgi:hypothetical protein
MCSNGPSQYHYLERNLKWEYYCLKHSKDNQAGVAPATRARHLHHQVAVADRHTLQ